MGTKAGLSRKETTELIDLLRRNLLYQTPRPIFERPEDDDPRWVEMRMLFKHQQRVVQLIHQAGGWTLSPEDKMTVLRKHEEVARVALGDGLDYDFSHLAYGDLVNMWTESAGVEGLEKFREAIMHAIADGKEE